MYKYGDTSMSRLRTVDTDLIRVAKRALEISGHRGGCDFTIPPHGGKRTVEEQQALFDKGVSKCDGINNRSYHQSGRALDVVAYRKGASWDELEEVAVCMLQAAIELGVDIEWGGNWRNGWDGAHYQLK